MWLRIVLTGLALEFVYGIYIGIIRWYEPTMLSSLVALGTLMLLGGYMVGRKAKAKHIIQGALVGFTGVLFLVIVSTMMGKIEDLSVGLQFWLEHLAKIAGGAIGGFIALKQSQ